MSACSLCGRLVCRRCLVMHDFIAPGSPSPFCPVCWDLGLRHRETLLELEAGLARERARMIENWRKDALKLSRLKRLGGKPPMRTRQVLDLDD
jgi:hypothetical protein